MVIEALRPCQKISGRGTHAWVPFQRAGRNRGRVANTKAAHFLCFFLVVLLGQGAELDGIFLLDGTAFSVEVLDVVEPRDAARDLRPRGLALGAWPRTPRQCCGIAETYPGIDVLEAILSSIRQLPPASAPCRIARGGLPLARRRTAAQCRPPCCADNNGRGTAAMDVR